MRVAGPGTLVPKDFQHLVETGLTVKPRIEEAIEVDGTAGQAEKAPRETETAAEVPAPDGLRRPGQEHELVEARGAAHLQSAVLTAHEKVDASYLCGWDRPHQLLHDPVHCKAPTQFVHAPNLWEAARAGNATPFRCLFEGHPPFDAHQ